MVKEEKYSTKYMRKWRADPKNKQKNVEANRKSRKKRLESDPAYADELRKKSRMRYHARKNKESEIENKS